MLSWWCTLEAERERGQTRVTVGVIAGNATAQERSEVRSRCGRSTGIKGASSREALGDCVESFIPSTHEESL